MIKVNEQDYLKAASQAVADQAAEEPALGIPVDPDVAEFMGAFEETAVNIDDVAASFDPIEE